MAHRLLILALLCGVRAPAQAQSQAPITPPESVALQMVDATRRLDWAGMARLMHPDALHQLRGLLTPLLETPGADDMREQVFGVRTISAAQALSDTAIFARLMQAAMGAEPMLASVMQSARAQILGHINEGPDTVHVVYRMSMQVDSMPISRLEVVSFARSEVGWRGVLKGDITALAARIKQALPRNK